jgi:hypothetical protein
MATVETLHPEARVIPDRTHLQRAEALQHANEIRLYRAQVKRALKAGELNIVDLLAGAAYEDQRLAMMKVYDLVFATPQFGRTRVNQLFVSCMIAQSKTVAGLTGRQRDELLYQVATRLATSAIRKHRDQS